MVKMVAKTPMTYIYEIYIYTLIPLQPTRAKSRYLSPEKLAFTKEHLNDSMVKGLYRVSSSEWSSPVVIITKRNGKFRLCGDYTELNKLTIRDAGPIPLQGNLFSFFANKPYMALFDLVSGYNQCPISDETAKLLAIVTPFGLYEPTRLPFGPTNAPAWFQRQMSTLLKDIPDARAFLDDCAIVGATFSEFKATLRHFFKVCQEAHLHLNVEKSMIGPQHLPFLGRLVGPTSLEIDPSRLDPLRNASPPSDKAALHSFLGLAQWFSPFVPCLATISSPLWELLKKNVPFSWNQCHEEAFERIKKAILDAPILAQLIPDAQLILQTDASSVGIAGVLFQVHPETAHWDLLSFYSCKLSSAETRYSTIELEALAIIFSLDRARQFIATRPITIMTDHSNLQFLRTSVNPRIQRWSLVLSEYDYIIIFHPGMQNFLADYLSCTFSPTSIRPLIEVITADVDPISKSLIDIILELPHFFIDNVLHLEQDPPELILLKLWALAHDDPLSGHGGRLRTLMHLQSAVVWPAMSSAVEKLCSTCPLCQKLRAHTSHPEAMASTCAHLPFESIFMDYLGPLRSSEGHHYILVIIDRFSHFVHLTAAKTTCAAPTVETLFNEWICQFGLPKLITSDGGSAFANEHMARITELLNINHHVSAPYHPEGHGPVEHANYDIAQTLRALFRGKTTWHQLLRPTTFALNTAFSRALGTSPFKVIHGFAPRLPIQHALGLASNPPCDSDPLAFADSLVSSAATIFSSVEQIQQQLYHSSLACYAHLAKGRTEYKVGEHVLVRFPHAEKLSLEWQGPFQIMDHDATSTLIYIIADLANQRRFHAHMNRLHIFYPGNLSEEQLLAETADLDEYFIEKVLSHERRNGILWFHVIWAGYPDYGDPRCRILGRLP